VLDHRRPDFPNGSVWVPILDLSDPENIRADPAQLDKVAVLVAAAIKAGRKVIVACGEGIERSPLAVAFVLWKKLGVPTFPEAYEQVQRTRPQVQFRWEWARGSKWDTRLYRWW
jgi:protein-tyrosine phosphatase